MLRIRRPALLLAAALLAAASRPLAAEAPAVRILEPGPDDVPLGDTAVRLDVSGSAPGDAVEVYVDGRRIGSANGEPWSVPWKAGDAPKARSVTAVLVRGGRELATARVRTRGFGFTATASTRVVSLSPVVLDGKRHYVSGLAKEDFSLLVDGRPQPIETFEAIDSRLSVILVLDVSASMALKLREMREAALGFLDALKPGDEAAVLTFSSGLVGTTRFSADHAAARAAIAEARVLGETALYDATAAALKELRGRKGRRAAVVFTDGEDNRSRLSVEQVVEMARGTEATIFAVGQGVADAGELRDYLSRMAEETGGRPFFISSVKKLGEVFQEVVRELQSQYLITFTPADQTPKSWHQVELRLRPPGLTARVRKTYLLE